MNTILVIGSCGYLGSALLPILRRSYNVVGMDALLWGQRGDPDTIIHDASLPGTAGIVRDLNPDAIVYLGAIAHDPDRQIDLTVHERHTYWAPLTLARKVEVPFVFASSLSSFDPKSGVYPTLKRLAELAMQELNHVSVLRFGTLFGGVEPVERFRAHLLLNSMVYGAARGQIMVNGGAQRRPVCSITRACGAIATDLDCFFNAAYTLHPGRSVRNVYNTCASVRQFGEYVSRFTGGCPVLVQDGAVDTRNYGWGEFNDDLLRSPLETLVAWTNQHLNEIPTEPRKLVAA